MGRVSIALQSASRISSDGELVPGFRRGGRDACCCPNRPITGNRWPFVRSGTYSKKLQPLMHECTTFRVILHTESGVADNSPWIIPKCDGMGGRTEMNRRPGNLMLDSGPRRGPSGGSRDASFLWLRLGFFPFPLTRAVSPFLSLSVKGVRGVRLHEEPDGGTQTVSRTFVPSLRPLVPPSLGDDDAGQILNRHNAVRLSRPQSNGRAPDVIGIARMHSLCTRLGLTGGEKKTTEGLLIPAFF